MIEKRINSQHSNDFKYGEKISSGIKKRLQKAEKKKKGKSLASKLGLNKPKTLAIYGLGIALAAGAIYWIKKQKD